jgi:WD40 repeat protein
VRHLRLPLLILVVSLLAGACRIFFSDDIESNNSQNYRERQYESLAISPNGLQYAAIELDCTLVVREIENDSTAWLVELGDSNHPIVNFTPAGSMVLVLDIAARLRVYDASDGDLLATHSDVYGLIDVSPDDWLFAFLDKPGKTTYTLRELTGAGFPSVPGSSAGQIANIFLFGYRSPVSFSGVGRMIEQSDSTVVVRLSVTENYQLKPSYVREFRVPDAAVTNAVISPDGASLIVGTRHNGLHVFSLATGELTFHTGSPIDPQYLPYVNHDGPYPLLVTDDSGTAIVVSTQNGRPYGGKWKLSAWDLADSGRITEYDVGNWQYSGYRVAFSPDGGSFIRMRHAQRLLERPEMVADAWDLNGNMLWQVILSDTIPTYAWGSWSLSVSPTGPVFERDGEHVLLGTYYGIWRIRIGDGETTRLRNWSERVPFERTPSPMDSLSTIS